MSPARTVRLIAGRELYDRLRNKAFLLGTFGTALVLAGAIIIPALMPDEEVRRFRLGVAGEVPDAFGDALEAELAERRAEATLVELSGRRAAAVAVRSRTLDAALVGTRELMVDGAPDPQLYAAVGDALHQASVAARLEGAGLSRQELAAVLEPPEPLAIVDPTGQREPGFEGWLVAFGATALLFMAVMINANSLLTGAVEEKSSRVIEVLLGSVRPWHLLAAKILTLTGLALGQIGVLVGAVLGANAYAGTVELPEATAATVATSLLMIVIGFVFYASLYTVAGSLAASMEDAQATAGPLGFAVAGAYFLVLFVVIPSPGGVPAQVLTYLPPTAPFTVPARVALGAIPLWEVALAAGATLGGAILTVRIAGRLYASSVLAGGKLTWRQAWQAEPIR